RGGNRRRHEQGRNGRAQYLLERSHYDLPNSPREKPALAGARAGRGLQPAMGGFLAMNADSLCGSAFVQRPLNRLVTMPMAPCGRRAAPSSVRIFVDHDLEGLEDDVDVAPDRPSGEIFEVGLEAVGEVGAFVGGAAIAADLGEAGEAGLAGV